MKIIKIHGYKGPDDKVKKNEITAIATRMLATSILNSGTTIIKSLPTSPMIHNSIIWLEQLGCDVKLEGNEVLINSENMSTFEIPYWVGNRSKYSWYIFSAIAGRFGKVDIHHDGNWYIGPNPLKSFETLLKELGFKSNEVGCSIHFELSDLSTSNIVLSDVGSIVTECIVMMYVLSKGVTYVSNIKMTQETEEFLNFFNEIGSNIERLENNSLKINGVERLGNVEIELEEYTDSHQCQDSE